MKYILLFTLLLAGCSTDNREIVEKMKKPIVVIAVSKDHWFNVDKSIVLKDFAGQEQTIEGTDAYGQCIIETYNPGDTLK